MDSNQESLSYQDIDLSAESVEFDVTFASSYRGARQPDSIQNVGFGGPNDMIDGDLGSVNQFDSTGHMVSYSSMNPDDTDKGRFPFSFRVEGIA